MISYTSRTRHKNFYSRSCIQLTHAHAPRKVYALLPTHHDLIEWRLTNSRSKNPHTNFMNSHCDPRLRLAILVAFFRPVGLERARAKECGSAVRLRTLASAPRPLVVPPPKMLILRNQRHRCCKLPEKFTTGLALRPCESPRVMQGSATLICESTKHSFGPLC